MTSIEKLKKGLDELGVEYDTYDLPNCEHGLSWIDGNNIEWEVVQQGENFRIHALQLVTPEQAISATVGAGTCHGEIDTDHFDCKLMTFTCKSCGWSGVIDDGYAGYSFGDTDMPRHCPNCGQRIKDEAE